MNRQWIDSKRIWCVVSTVVYLVSFEVDAVHSVVFLHVWNLKVSNFCWCLEVVLGKHWSYEYFIVLWVCLCVNWFTGFSKLFVIFFNIFLVIDRIICKWCLYPQKQMDKLCQFFLSGCSEEWLTHKYLYLENLTTGNGLVCRCYSYRPHSLSVYRLFLYTYCISCPLCRTYNWIFKYSVLLYHSGLLCIVIFWQNIISVLHFYVNCKCNPEPSI